MQVRPIIHAVEAKQKEANATLAATTIEPRSSFRRVGLIGWQLRQV